MQLASNSICLPPSRFLWGLAIAGLLASPSLLFASGKAVVPLEVTERERAQHEGDSITQQGQLNDLLAWAIEHSDKEELSKRAKEVADFGLETAAYAHRRAEIKQVMDMLRDEPTERELMVEALSIAKNESTPLQKRLEALEALRYLVEPIDNAIDLLKIGGLEVLHFTMVGSQQPDLQVAAAYALGTAASNNPAFQKETLAMPGLIPGLLKGALSKRQEVSEKSLYAMSALISSNEEGQLQFYGANGVASLRQLLEFKPSLSQLRKVLDLLTDLTSVEGEVKGQAGVADRKLIERVLGLMKHPDSDIQERALLALISMGSKAGANRVMRDSGGLKAVKEAEERSNQLLAHANAEYSQVLEHLLVLQGDLTEVLSQEIAERSEL